MKCLKCEKEIERLAECPSNLNDAGTLVVHFGYGSRHDMRGGWERPVATPPGELGLHGRRDLLLSCDEVRAYVCDDCFATHARLFDGFQVRKVQPVETKIV